MSHNKVILTSLRRMFPYILCMETGPDGLHGFWLKKFTSLDKTKVKYLDDCIKTADVPNWMVESRTVLIQEDARKGNAAGNYRPIACLNLLRKLLIGIITENVYDHLNQQKLLPE